MDINRSIRVAVDTGKVVLGTKKVLKYAKHGEGQLVILAENCVKEVSDDIKYYCEMANIPVYIHESISLELGAICGKPFPVSALVVLEPGNSTIMSITSEKKEESKDSEELDFLEEGI